jgi:two-component system, OmpR family, sensor histidine kinase BaeS
MPGRLGPLGIRFAVAFVGVALLAIAIFALAVLIADQGNVARLAAGDRDRTTAALAALAQNSYRSSEGWTGADLRPLTAFAQESGVGVDLRDESGADLLSVPAPGSPARGNNDLEQEQISDGASPIGSVSVTFPGGGLNTGDRHLRAALLSAVGWSAAAAVLGALLVGVGMARGVVQPIRRLSTAVKSLRLGASSMRLGPNAGPGELGELGRAFDAMAVSLEREDQLRRALVADVAHELRTPIAIMQAETEALADGMIPASPAALSSLNEEAVRLARMVEDLQTLASAEASGLDLQPRLLDLGRVAADAAESLSRRFRASGVELEQRLPPTPALGDPRRLHQVVTNLLDNAAKYTPPGGKVTVRSGTEDGAAVLEVSDTGPGIPLNERSLVWDRFYRGGSGRFADGSGIGLAVVKELVDAHGGRISVGDAAGGGARFTVQLPRLPAPAATG